MEAAAKQHVVCVYLPHTCLDLGPRHMVMSVHYAASSEGLNWAETHWALRFVRGLYFLSHLSVLISTMTKTGFSLLPLGLIILDLDYLQ